MKKALRKNFIRGITGSMGRFVSIMAIVFLGVAFFTGIRATEPDMRLTADSYLDRQQCMDVKLTSSSGFSTEDIQKIEDTKGVAKAEAGYEVQVLSEIGGVDKVIDVRSVTKKINRLRVVRGRLPSASDECIIDEKMAEADGIKIGDEIEVASGSDMPVYFTLRRTRFRVTGIAKSPEYLTDERGLSNIGDGTVYAFIGVDDDAFAMKTASDSFSTYTVVYVRGSGLSGLNCYSSSYEKRTDRLADRLGDDWKDASVTTRSDLPMYDEYGSNAEKIGKLANVFPVMFFLIAALVSLTAMTRMVDEEREEVGTLLALGYSRKSVFRKYTDYCILATLTGAVLGGLLGEKLLPDIIVTAYATVFKNIEGTVTPYDPSGIAIAAAIALGLNLIATLSACGSLMRSTPAALMRPRPPKEGSSILLERIGPIWRRLSFSVKASMRNLFRYKKRMIMTVVGIGGCTALLLIGFGVRDSVSSMVEEQYGSIMTYDLRAELSSGADSAEADSLLASSKRVSSSLKVHTASADVDVSGGTDQSATVIVPKDVSELRGFIRLRDRESGRKISLGSGGAVISEKLSTLTGAERGDRITVTIDGSTYSVRVADVTENYLNHYIYMTPGYYEKITGGSPSYDTRFVKLKSTDDEKTVSRQLLDCSGVQGVLRTSDVSGVLEDTLDMLQVVIFILIFSAGLLAFVVIFNLNIIAITERKRELATLKVLGFYDTEVSAYVYRENIVLTLMGIVVGLLLGTMLHGYIMTTVETDVIMFGRIINTQSYWMSVALTAVFAVVVNAITHLQIKKIDMIESLKSVE
jgi:putative ABC transport system permease protein